MNGTAAAPDAEFEAKRAEWIRCLDHHDETTGKLDQNAILSQVYDLVWSGAAYRVVNVALRHAERDERGGVKQPPFLHQLLNRCFFQAQLVSIRRLLDRGAMSGKYGVFSLRRLVLDMAEHRQLLTRARLLEHTVAHFDRDPPSERDQSRIDRLTGVAPTHRSPQDVVAEAVFLRLRRELDALDRFADHARKFVAHAATPESRAEVPDLDAKLTYGDLWAAHATLCRTCQFIDCHLLRGVSHGFLPESRGDIFRHADRPLVATADLQTLRQSWRECSSEIERWTENALDWIVEPA